MRHEHKIGFFIKWCFDRVGAFFGLLIISPLLLILIILHKIFMPKGKVFFWQDRVGQHGKIFKILKFRTMKDLPVLDEATHHEFYITVAGDPRIPKFGAWLRKTKVDSLIELINILIGDMSFVGPRPDVKGYADLLEGDNRKILLLKPGLTGPASLKYRHEEVILSQVDDPVSYNDNIIYPDKVKINLNYYYNQSIFLDIKILIKTILGKTS